MNNSIYITKESEKIVKDLYDKQVQSLGIDYEDIYVDTRFGKTHLLKVGNPKGIPIIFFHGGNSTAPYSLKKNLKLIKDCLIFVPDTIGHPGKSDQKVLSSKTLEYGEWSSDVIDALGFKEIVCMGESFGGGVLAKLMCVSPEKIAKAIFIVPAGICNVSAAKILISMGFPILIYVITKKDKWLEKAIIPMALNKKNIDDDTLEMVRTTFQHVSVKTGMPSNVKAKEIRNYKAPTLLFAGEKDCLFPGDQVIKRAKKIIPQVETYLLKDCGHMYFCPEKSSKEIKEIIDNFLTK